MANNPVTRNVLKYKGAGNVQVFPNLPTMINGSQDGSDVGTGGPGLATISTPAAGSFVVNRNIEFLNDRYALTGNNAVASVGVYKKNQGGVGLWGRVRGGEGQGAPVLDELQTGLHVLHPNGVPTLAYLKQDAFQELRFSATVDGLTGAIWGANQGTAIETDSANPLSSGQSIVYRNSIVWVHQKFTGAAGAGIVSQYDLVTTVLTRYDVVPFNVSMLASGHALHVHDNVLFLFGFRDSNERALVHKLSAGSFTNIYEDSTQGYLDTNTAGHSALFTDSATGNLIVLMTEVNKGNSAPRAKVVSLADATGAATPTDISTTVMGSSEGADKYLEGGGSANRNRRWSVFVDADTAPATPRTFLTTWVPGGSTETWEWVGIGAEMEAVSSLQGISDDFALPYETAGGGHRSPRTAAVEIGDSSNPPVEVDGGTKFSLRVRGSASLGTATFRGTDSEGSPSTIIPIVASSLTIGKGFLTELSIYWKFNNDVVGEAFATNVLTLTEIGSVPFATALIDDGLDFPGTTGNYFNHVAVDALKIGKNNEPFTISCWVNFDDLTGGAVLCSQSNYTTNGFTFEVLADGTVQMRWPANVTINTASGLIDTVSGFQHVLVTSSGFVTKIYVDNVLAATGSSHPTQNSTTVFTVGARDNGTVNIDGKMDELAIWSRAVDVNEVGYLFNTGSGFELDATTPFAVTPSISGNTITNLLPDNGATLYNITLDVTSAGIDEGDVGLIVVELV